MLEVDDELIRAPLHCSST